MEFPAPSAVSGASRTNNRSVIQHTTQNRMKFAVLRDTKLKTTGRGLVNVKAGDTVDIDTADEREVLLAIACGSIGVPKGEEPKKSATK